MGYSFINLIGHSNEYGLENWEYSKHVKGTFHMGKYKNV